MEANGKNIKKEGFFKAFIKSIKEEDYINAYRILSETTVLPGICGRICPHTKQCEGSCIRGIKSEPESIGELEAFIRRCGNKRKLRISHTKY